MKAKKIEVPVFDLQTHHSKVQVPTEFDLRDLSRKHHVFPLKVVRQNGRKRLLLAMRNPFDQKALFDVEFRAGMPAIPVQADETDVQWLIQTHYFGRKLSPTPRAETGTLSFDLFEQLELVGEAQTQEDLLSAQFEEFTDD